MVESVPEAAIHWEADTARVVFSPTVVNGRVFFRSQLWDKEQSYREDVMYSSDADTGELHWDVQHHSTRQHSNADRVYGDLVAGAPFVNNDTVFCGGKNLIALDAESGTEKWRFEGMEMVSSPTESEEIVYASGPSSVIAVDADSGRELWRFNTGIDTSLETATVTSPTVCDGSVYVVAGHSSDTTLYRLDALTGEPELVVDGLRTQTNARIEPPTVAGGTVYVANDSLTAIDAETGKEYWEYTPTVGFCSPPTVAAGLVYAGCWAHSNALYGILTGVISSLPVRGNQLYALDAETGATKWSYQANGPIQAGPTVADGHVYVPSMDKQLYALDADTGQKRWQFDLDGFPHKSPLVVDGVIYVGAGGKLYAIDTDRMGSSIDSRALLGTEGHHGQSLATDVTQE